MKITILKVTEYLKIPFWLCYFHLNAVQDPDILIFQSLLKFFVSIYTQFVCVSTLLR